MSDNDATVYKVRSARYLLIFNTSYMSSLLCLFTDCVPICPLVLTVRWTVTQVLLFRAVQSCDCYGQPEPEWFWHASEHARRAVAAVLPKRLPQKVAEEGSRRRLPRMLSRRRGCRGRQPRLKSKEARAPEVAGATRQWHTRSEQ